MRIDFFLEPGYDHGFVDSPTQTDQNWANSNRKFLHALHQKRHVSFFPGGFATVQHVEICRNVINMKYHKKTHSSRSAAPFYEKKRNDLFFFVGLVGEIQIVKSSSDRLEKQKVL